jgi:hypothetical protein
MHGRSPVRLTVAVDRSWGEFGYIRLVGLGVGDELLYLRVSAMARVQICVDGSALCRGPVLGSGGFLECHGIHAIAQPTGRRSIRENMAEVRVAGVANRLDPFQECRSVKTISDHIGRNGLGE